MKKLILATILFSLFLFSSCKKDDPSSDYEGIWSGQYSGEDTGNWDATINADGIVNGTAVSDSFPGFPFDLNGAVSESGVFEAQADVLIQTIDFTGQINNSAVSGEWKNSTDIEGVWSGNKH